TFLRSASPDRQSNSSIARAVKCAKSVLLDGEARSNHQVSALPAVLPSQSISLELILLHHFRPSRDFGFHLRAELRRSAGDDIRALGCEALGDAGAAHRLHDVVVE